jgi:hypothetical protein
MVEFPLDTVKVRLQTQNALGLAHGHSLKIGVLRTFNGPLDCLFSTIRNEGFRALYSGAWQVSVIVRCGALVLSLLPHRSRTERFFPGSVCVRVVTGMAIPLAGTVIDFAMMFWVYGRALVVISGQNTAAPAPAPLISHVRSLLL